MAFCCLICLVCVALLAVVGCTPGTGTPAGSSDASPAVGANMAGTGDVGTVTITRAALESTPQPWVLTTPESAVRSYLDWTSYAYRIGTSSVATPTMTGNEEVRVDSFIQLNLQNRKLIDQTLSSIAFGKSSIEGTHTLLPSKEDWTYRYVSTQTAGRTVGGPYSVSYDVTYTVVAAGKGHWRVDSVDVKALGEVK